ncbi:PA2169 family four-helix-bundle protein [Niallia taxi]|uniref:DUF2383 domain-containing protein n=1 Tax=Niallia taxi TaxID=2499688 RepID=UPI002934D3A9|nr:DUF2383 domain-containing protein [Niallia taxi]WOD61811.1 PA2169 family four-helix-bundle protein [Niallia taxi]
MNTDQSIKTLNKFLQGQYMGIHSYEHFIQNLEDMSLKLSFTDILTDHTKNAHLISERITRLGGEPADSEGIIGKTESFIGNIFDPDKGDEVIIKHAIKGENLYGIKMSEQLVRDKLDDESMDLVHQILNNDREHVDFLKSLIH